MVTATVDLDAVRQACQPIARWWRAYLDGADPDPQALARATTRARLLGPVPGAVGRAITYILSGCPDLDYRKAHAAFSRIAAVADRSDHPAAASLADPSPGEAVQLSLAGIPAGRPTKRRRAGRR